MSKKSNNIVLLSTFDNDVGKRSLYDSSNNQKITEEILLTNVKTVKSCNSKSLNYITREDFKLQGVIEGGKECMEKVKGKTVVDQTFEQDFTENNEEKNNLVKKIKNFLNIDE